jgi:hypothetical protein
MAQSAKFIVPDWGHFIGQLGTHAGHIQHQDGAYTGLNVHKELEHAPFKPSPRQHYRYPHRLNMDLDLQVQNLCGLHVHSCTHWLRPCNLLPPHPPAFVGSYIRGRYWSAQIDGISLSLAGYTSDDTYYCKRL